MPERKDGEAGHGPTAGQHRALSAGSELLDSALLRLRGEILAWQPQQNGGRATRRRLVLGIDALRAELWRADEINARAAPLAHMSKDLDAPAQLIQLCNDLAAALRTVQTELFAKAVESRLGELDSEQSAIDQLQAISLTSNGALKLLEQLEMQLQESERTRAQTIARLESSRLELGALKEQIALGQRLLGSPRQQMDRAIREANALTAVTRAIPFQLGYLITTAIRSPRSLARAPRAFFRLVREALRRRGAARAEQFSMPLDVVGIPLPQEWQEVIEFGQDSSKLVKASAALIALPLAKPPGSAGAISRRPQSIGTTRMAVIVDEFTAIDLAGQCEIVPVSKQAWKKQLNAFQPHILLVESAWHGNQGEWTGDLETASAELRALLSYCQANGIPTVFWNKEDPVHFEVFATAAALFDHVATTDLDCIAQYRELLGHEKIYLLPFAADPRRRNPIESVPRRDACSFAGTYYPKYHDRNEAFSSIVKALQDYVPVDIYDRNGGSSSGDYAFPEQYKSLIVGSLPFSAIDIAYKTYKYGITLNTAPNSQSMVARRTFELLASGTIVISNYSRAIRLLFGDIVLAADNSPRLQARWAWLHGERTRIDKVRLLGLRKILSEHTVQHRLGHLFSTVFGVDMRPRSPRVTVVAYAGTSDEYDAILRSYSRQAYPYKTLKIVLAAGVAPDRRPCQGIALYSPAQARHADIAESDEHIACMSPRDYYGPQYLTDMALATAYAAGRVVGKGAYYRWRDEGPIRSDSDGPYREVSTLALRRALLPAAAIEAPTLWDLVLAVDGGAYEGTSLALDEFSYCENAARREIPEVDDITMDVGLPLQQLQDAAEWMTAAQKSAGENPGYSCQDLFPAATHAHKKVVVSHGNANAVDISSTLPPNGSTYVYAVHQLPLATAAPRGFLQFKLRAGGKLSCKIAAIFIGSQGERVGSHLLSINVDHHLKVPAEAQSILFGLRVSGGGTLNVKELSIGHKKPQRQRKAILTRSPRLLVGKGYPSGARLYHYSFIHRRVLAYREGGLRHAIFRWNPGRLAFDEFEGIDVISGGGDHLAGLIGHNQFSSIDVHPLYPEMWAVLREHVSSRPINIWVHGAEIQPWYRRPYNYPPGPLRDRAVAATTNRLGMWREIFALRHPNIHLIFVSHYLADQSMADIGVELDPSQYSIIHNFIDENMFEYVPKPEQQRTKILSVRPYNSLVYANDLSVKAILALSEEPFFKELEFLLVGDGELFESTLEPLRKFQNVQIRKGFLSQRELANLHKDYGLFLVPTRMDSQGVSRDEAMASGLVPLTNRVAAIPEFVDEEVGIVADAEDWRGLAAGIKQLYLEPSRFLRMSEAAAGRVRRQSGYDATIAKEMTLIRGEVPEPGSVKNDSKCAYRFALYGDLNLNVTDGSALWAVSVAQVLAAVPGAEVAVYLKAPVSTLHIIEPLLALGNVRLIAPSPDDLPVRSIHGALRDISADDAAAPFDAVLLRGFDLCAAATEYPSLEGRLWVYITDLPHQGESYTAELRGKIDKIIAHAAIIFCQTSRYEQHLHALFPLSEGKTAILPPMIPDVGRSNGFSRQARPLRMVYAGKFAPLWGIREMFEVFDLLRAQFPELELHVYGDKIHNVPDDLEFKPQVIDRLTNTPGIVWHKQVSREELLQLLPECDLGWAWRRAELEVDTLELSTKVLEYAACGLPTIVYPNQINREILGDDYPLYAETPAEAVAAIASCLTDAGMRERLEHRLREVASRYTFEATKDRYVMPMLDRLHAS
jgi:glycosyltransferase involved in cell wall biosynthesis/spore maturation protein CgeB